MESFILFLAKLKLFGFGAVQSFGSSLIRIRVSRYTGTLLFKYSNYDYWFFIHFVIDGFIVLVEKIS
jgi:hypothetical protein